MIFYDFEVFSHDWLVVAIDMTKKNETVIVNDVHQLARFYDQHHNDIWTGYNSRHYDQFILRAILLGMDPKELNDFIIEEGCNGWMFSDLFKTIPLYNYDVMAGNDRGLKACEAFMGHDIQETSVDFNTDRKLTKEEIAKEVEYCRNDVVETIAVFMKRKEDFMAQMALLKMFDMPLAYISKTKVQLSAEILGATKNNWRDEFDIHIPECAIIRKYTHVADWFTDPTNHHYLDGKKTHQLKTIMAGCEMVFGWGGAHGAVPNYHTKGWFINVDVESLYPSIDCLWPEWCFSRSVPKHGVERFKQMKASRLKLKHEGKKKEQAPYKIVLNGSYGAMKDKNSKLYDPRGANNTCVYGQLLVGVDLLERFEETGVCKIIQVNTDGILLKLDRYEDFDIVDDVAHEWETRTGLILEFDDYGWGELWQKDVNNYLIKDGYTGKFKRKGSYIKELNDLDYDLPILNKALVEYMVNGTPIETTILGCQDLKEFQMVRKVSGKYTHAEDAYGRKYAERTLRLFASKNAGDTRVYKISTRTGKPEKLSDCPDHARVYNKNVNGQGVPDWLDRNWYINKAKERLKGFGVKL